MTGLKPVLPSFPILRSPSSHFANLGWKWETAGDATKLLGILFPQGISRTQMIAAAVESKLECGIQRSRHLVSFVSHGKDNISEPYYLS